MGPVVRYTLLRAGLFAVVAAVLWLVGLRGVLWAGGSVIVSAGLSYALLARQRDAVAERLVRARGERAARPRRSADDLAEDAALGDEPPR